MTDTLKNDVINKLRTQYLTLAEREADWAKRYGSYHLAVVNIRNQMNEIRNSILDELRRIAESYRSDYEIAKQRQAGIEQDLAQAVAKSQITDRAQVQLGELESNAQSYRTLYDDFLKRYTESVQAQSFPITEVRVFTPASRPFKKSHPKTLFVLLISTAGGLILGLLIGHLRDLTDQAFRTRDQVERSLGLECLATVPRIKARKPKGPRAPAPRFSLESSKSLPSLAPNGNVGDWKDVLPSAQLSLFGEKPFPVFNLADLKDMPFAPVSKLNEPEAEPKPAANIETSEPEADPKPTANIGVGEPEADPKPAANIEVSEPEGGSSQAVDTVSEAVDQRIIGRVDDLMWQVVDFPLSPYTEAIRSIKMAADLTRARISKKNRSPKTILGITSSTPSEGKSTIAASLAFLISHSGKRVMLVDCDLRAPRLTRVLAPDAKAGILEVISGDAALHDVIWTDQSKNLSFLPAVGTARIFHTAEILGSDELQALFGRLRDKYDYIIADLTPLVPIIDVRATGKFVDHYVFVVEWGRTKVDMVERSLREAAGVYNKILGVVLNKVDSRDLKRYEGYGTYDYDKYYRR